MATSPCRLDGVGGDGHAGGGAWQFARMGGKIHRGGERFAHPDGVEQPELVSLFCYGAGDAQRLVGVDFRLDK